MITVLFEFRGNNCVNLIFYCLKESTRTLHCKPKLATEKQG